MPKLMFSLGQNIINLQKKKEHRRIFVPVLFYYCVAVVLKPAVGYVFWQEILDVINHGVVFFLTFEVVVVELSMRYG